MNTIGNVIDREGVENIVDLVYPVGSIYLSVNSVNPSTLFGGTWEVWGSGKVPVGVDTSDTDFDTVEETGGAKTESYTPAGSNTAVTLTAAQSGIPAHSHGLNSHTHSIPALSGTAASNGSHTHNLYKQIDNYSGNQLHVKEDSSSSTVVYYNTDNSKKTLSDGSHTHTVTTNASTSGQATGSTANNTAANATASHNHSFTGTAATINHLQPYITCYMWKRTA